MKEPRPSRRWIWFFVALAALAATSLAILYRSFWSRQLKPEQVEDARALWKHNGPRNYDLKWTQQGSVPGTFYVKVRGGKVVSVTRNGEPLETRLYPYWDVPALFTIIDRFLEEDAKPNHPRTFTTATFDPHDGHVIRFYRRVLGTSEQQEILIELTPVAAEGAPKA